MKRLLCMVFGHKYALVRKYTPTQRRVCCTRCGEHYAMHDSLQALLPWDGEFAELYSDFA